MQNWQEFIFSEVDFDSKVGKVFNYQYENNPVFNRYCKALIDIGVFKDDNFPWLNASTKEPVPLLPIQAYKNTDVTTGQEEEHDLVFRSSGTSQMQKSVHRVKDHTLYEVSLLQGFRNFYQLDSAVIWGYTPGYSDNPDSSLVYMIKTLIDTDESGMSCFLPLDEPMDEDSLSRIGGEGKQLILFGAAFGLLDLLEMKKTALPSDTIVIETGGMKTHSRELSREELHRRLAEGFNLDRSRIHSEYGMAEILSQAYATGGNWFRTVPWMKVSIRNPDNPFEEQPLYSEGLIGIIDLANIHSCSFLLTGDRGVMDDRGRFQVLGRWNPKDLRGCNFLIGED